MIFDSPGSIILQVSSKKVISFWVWQGINWSSDLGRTSATAWWTHIQLFRASPALFQCYCVYNNSINWTGGLKGVKNDLQTHIPLQVAVHTWKGARNEGGMGRWGKTAPNPGMLTTECGSRTAVSCLYWIGRLFGSNIRCDWVPHGTMLVRVLPSLQLVCNQWWLKFLCILCINHKKKSCKNKQYLTNKYLNLHILSCPWRGRGEPHHNPKQQDEKMQSKKLFLVKGLSIHCL